MNSSYLQSSLLVIIIFIAMNLIITYLLIRGAVKSALYRALENYIIPDKILEEIKNQNQLITMMISALGYAKTEVGKDKGVF